MFKSLHAQRRSCRKLLNCFWKSKFILGMPKCFEHGREGEKLSLVKSKKFWHFQNEIELPKHRLEIQKFRSLEDSSLCSKLLFDNTFSIESFKCSRMDIFGEFS